MDLLARFSYKKTLVGSKGLGSGLHVFGYDVLTSGDGEDMVKDKDDEYCLTIFFSKEKKCVYMKAMSSNAYC